MATLNPPDAHNAARPRGQPADCPFGQLLVPTAPDRAVDRASIPRQLKRRTRRTICMVLALSECRIQRRGGSVTHDSARISAKNAGLAGSLLALTAGGPHPDSFSSPSSEGDGDENG